MERYFFSSVNPIELDKKFINEGDLIKFSFHESSIPHFSKTGVGVIKNIFPNSVDIVIDKYQKFYDTSAYGDGISLTSGLLLKSIVEDNNNVVFNIPLSYIWCIDNV